MKEPRILIVDDSKFDRMMLTKSFSQADDVSVLTEAESAADALSKLNEEEFDAIFLDIRMPGENGFCVLRNVRSRMDSTWPLVFMMSSSSHPDDVREAYSSRATAYLTKPNGIAEVREIANSCLGLIRGAAGTTHAKCIEWAPDVQRSLEGGQPGLHA